MGELVNIFRKGSLVGTHADSQIQAAKPILYGTSDGSIGIIVQLGEEHHKYLYQSTSNLSLFRFLSEVEKVIGKETHNCARISHASYRQFHNQKINTAVSEFVSSLISFSVMDLLMAIWSSLF